MEQHVIHFDLAWAFAALEVITLMVTRPRLCDSEILGFQGSKTSRFWASKTLRLQDFRESKILRIQESCNLIILESQNLRILESWMLRISGFLEYD